MEIKIVKATEIEYNLLIYYFRVEAPGKKLCCRRTPLEVVLFVMFCISTAVAVALIIVLATRTETTIGEYMDLLSKYHRLLKMFKIISLSTMKVFPSRV